jgi:hypothetical protein
MERRTPIFKVFLMSILFMNLFIISSYAQQTKKISLQGFLKDGNGKAVADGNQEMIFKLYPSKEGGTAEWEETQTINVFGGVYSTHLGKTVALDNLNWGTKTYFVGVTVQGSELNPRTELTFAPYSLGSPSADVANTVKCSGAVGDIKYSILNPTQFALQNGSCWVPMDGRSLAVNDKLRLIIPTMANIPDGGGLFLRSQEFSSSFDQDPERTSTSPIATMQEQALKSHSHNATLSVSGSTNYTGAHSHGTNLGQRGFDADGGDQALTPRQDENGNWRSSNDGDHWHTISGSATGATNTDGGGTETRPKNLNFWIYIRIN